MEERFASEDHGREHGTQRPHVERVVVLLVVDEQFRAFEVTRGDANVVFGAGVVEFSKTPVNQTELAESASSRVKFSASRAHLSLLVVDHNVVRFHVPMHDALAMAEIERFEQLEDVEAHIVVGELWI